MIISIVVVVVIIIVISILMVGMLGKGLGLGFVGSRDDRWQVLGFRVAVQG